MSVRTYSRKAAKTTGTVSSRYASPARPFVAQGPPAETPDLEAQMDRAERFGHHFSRIRVTSEAPDNEREAGGPVPLGDTSPSEAPIQRRGHKGKRRRRRAQQWKRQKRAWKRQAAQQGDAPEVDDVSSEASSEPDAPDPDDVAWDRSVSATQELLPSGRPLVKRAAFHGEDAPEALTHFSGGRINVDYNPDLQSGRSDRRIGQLAQTFTHELAVHGANLGNRDVDEEHGSMHAPESRGEYLGASHRTFNRLGNETQKRAFARAWSTDMENQISWDENLGKGERRARRDWVRKRRNSMVDAIRRPDRHAWTEEE
jgi:hypothetical protein